MRQLELITSVANLHLADVRARVEDVPLNGAGGRVRFGPAAIVDTIAEARARSRADHERLISIEERKSGAVAGRHPERFERYKEHIATYERGPGALVDLPSPSEQRKAAQRGARPPPTPRFTQR